MGSCPIGEASVVIAVSSAHRREAVEGAHFAIDELKRTVPIWKKVVVVADLIGDMCFKTGAYHF